MSNLFGDLRYALRVLKKNPGFTAMAVVALTLGIGANTAIFSVVNSLLLRPLPIPHAGRVVVIWETNPALGSTREGSSGPTALDWRDRATCFEEVAVLEPGTGTFTGKGEPVQFPGARVTPNTLDIFGVKVVMGRGFREDERLGGRKDVAVLSYGMWERMLGADPNAIGSKATVDGLPYTLIGVMARDSWFPFDNDGMVPWNEDWLQNQRRDDRRFSVLARMKPGVTIEQAQAEMDGISRRLATEHQEMKGWSTKVMPLQQVLTETIRPALLVLLGAVGFVLLIACANVAGLLLARASGRQREVSVRTALGAGRGRLVRQFLTESVLLFGIGGAFGLLAGTWSLEFLRRILPDKIPLANAGGVVSLANIEFDHTVFFFTLAVSIVTGILFGLAPAFHGTRADVAGTLKQTGRTLSGGMALRRMQRILVVGEVAVALVLLIGAGLMIRTVWNLQHQNPGFRPDRLLTMQIELPTDTGYKTDAQQIEFFRNVLREIKAVPGVVSTAYAATLPMDSQITRRAFRIEGRSGAAATENVSADLNVVTPGYFDTMGIPLKKGRTFTEFDDSTKRNVVVVDETFARRFFPNEDAIGKRFSFSRTWEIVGVVGGVRHGSLAKEPQPTAYFPHAQVGGFQGSLVTRTQGDPATMTGAVKQAVYRVDANQPVFDVRTMESLIGKSESSERLTLILLAVFAALALLMASIGVYGVMTFAVNQRRQEIGIRMAMGARRGDVLGMVIRQGLSLGLAGVAIGAVGAFLLTQVLASLLYGVSPTDPLMFAGISALLLAVTLLACFLPARSASVVDPMIALRYE